MIFYLFYLQVPTIEWKPGMVFHFKNAEGLTREPIKVSLEKYFCFIRNEMLCFVSLLKSELGNRVKKNIFFEKSVKVILLVGERINTRELPSSLFFIQFLSACHKLLPHS